MITREEAHKLVEELVGNVNLRKHMYCVEQAMRDYAERLGENVEAWGLAGLLHDADWEKFPEVHPKELVKRLNELNKKTPGSVPDEVINAIASHGDMPDRFIPRTTKIDHFLFACDELSGFVIANALVNPQKLGGVKVESVIKKMKDKAFAKGVNREDIVKGVEEIGIPIEEHVTNVLSSLLKIRSVLGL